MSTHMNMPITVPVSAPNPSIPIDPEGRFAGYASVFSEKDSGGDMVMPGAFRKSLRLRGRHRVKMLFQHDPADPVGTWDEIVEDGYGLFVRGRLVPEVPRAEALRRLIARGAVDGLSIGFRTVKADRLGPGASRRLHEVDLWEISIVTFPMMERARIAGKSAGHRARLNRSLSAAIALFRT